MKLKYYAAALSLCVFSLSGIAQCLDNNGDGFTDYYRFGTEQIVQSPMAKDTGDVIHTIPAPGSRCYALTFDGEYLWTADYYDKIIYQVETENGDIIKSFPYPEGVNFLEGMTWDGESLWATTWQESNGNGTRIYQIDPTDGSVIKNIPYNTEDPWPHGITYDGSHLWVCNFLYEQGNEIEKIDSETGDILQTIATPSPSAIGLTWDGNSLWTNDFETHLLYELTSGNGTVELTAPSPCYNPRDMAWDGDYIWVMSWQNATIYQLTVGPAGLNFWQENPDFTVAPNPVTTASQLHFNAYNTQFLELAIISMTGKTIAQKHFSANEINAGTIALTRLNIPASAHGLFLLRIIQNESKSYVIKLYIP